MGCHCSKQLRRYSRTLSSFSFGGSVHEEERPDGMLFDMWVVSVEDLLKMEGPPIYHQVLIEKGVVVKWKPGMFVAFISHQWIDGPHPDPKGRQLSALISFVKNLRAHKVSVTSDMEIFMTTGSTESLSKDGYKALTEGYVWLDYFSIPQCEGQYKTCPITRQQQIDAIATIPVYVEQCEVFLVLCPPLRHAITSAVCDLASWKERGWCRAELVARFLSTKKRPSVLVMKSPTKATFISISMATLVRVGLGKFSVPGDKGPLKRLLENAHSRKIKTYNFQDRSDWESIFVKCLGESLCDGLTDDQDSGAPTTPSPEEQQAWLESYGFKHWLDNPPHRYGPLHCTCTSNNLGMLRAALAAGAGKHVNDIVYQAPANVNMPTRVVPLGSACLEAGPEVVAELLNARADCNIRCSTGFSHLEMIACRPPDNPKAQVEMAKLLVEAGATLRPGGLSMSTALNATCYSASYDLAVYLLEMKSNPNDPDVFGCTAMHWVGIYSGKPEMAELLLKYRADPDVPARPSTAARPVLFGARAASPFMTFGEVGNFLKDMTGSTPLHQAARNGNVNLSKVLLDAGANPSRRNANGKTPLDLARFYEHADLVRFYQTGLENSQPLGTLAQV